MTLQQLLISQRYVVIPLLTTPTQHFQLSAKINGIEGRFILDTGASNTCVGMEHIVYFDLDTKLSEIKATGAGSSDIETLLSVRNHLKIGTWEMKRTPLVLFDLTHVNAALIHHNAEPVHGIIGADILKKGKAVINYPKKKLYLKL
ncbi:retropepsin-like aspartic protease [Capnocytophaga canis]|uniref:retropepsin-like aspartic protease n=1 Tax=Capnocytophaga canis TaxID=1848903 RepID=UPI001562750D|nr:retropepsin-like aspartic protease [Capnocytophaga canis]